MGVPCHSTLGKPRVLGLLSMDVGLKVPNVTVKVVGIVKFVFLKVTKVMNVHIPLGGAQSALWCVLGIELQSCGQQEVTVGIVTDPFSIECLELISLVLYLVKFLLGMCSILEHVHLLFRTEV